jgi:hypothetical protein
METLDDNKMNKTSQLDRITLINQVYISQLKQSNVVLTTRSNNQNTTIRGINLYLLLDNCYPTHQLSIFECIVICSIHEYLYMSTHDLAKALCTILIINRL